jgi:hypothetical protein
MAGWEPRYPADAVRTDVGIPGSYYREVNVEDFTEGFLLTVAVVT